MHTKYVHACHSLLSESCSELEKDEKGGTLFCSFPYNNIIVSGVLSSILKHANVSTHGYETWYVRVVHVFTYRLNNNK